MRPSLKGQNIAVFGLGKSGSAAVRLLIKEGAHVTVFDERQETEISPDALSFKSEGVAFHCGPLIEGAFDRAQCVVVSPGVPLAQRELDRARARKIPVWGEVELAYRFLDSSSRFVGITGTNGKSTTTALTGEIFGRSGLRTFVGGNLGRPLSESPFDPQAFAVHVVELSSFQLEGIESLRCTAAAILNLAPDHLDRYRDQTAYAAAKGRILVNQRDGDFAVVNADDAAVMRLAERTKVPLFGFSVALPTLPSRLAGGALLTADGFSIRSGSSQHPFHLKNRALRGAHNVQNAMAAALLAFHSRISVDTIQQGLDAFAGLPHRLESVRTLEGVEWINDSKATNVDSALVALRAFAGNVWLIAGGKGKGAPYTPLVDLARGRVKAVLTVGADAAAIEEAFRGTCPVESCGTLEKAIAQARAQAKPGDTVLLSPACASYDQFKNFEDRGDRFKLWVRSLA